MVDDEAGQRSAVSRMIERWGFDTATASDGGEAVRLTQESDFDAIVTDLMMPGMDGMELLKRLREDAAASPSVIVLTGYGNIDTAPEPGRDEFVYSGVDRGIFSTDAKACHCAENRECGEAPRGGC